MLHTFSISFIISYELFKFVAKNMFKVSKNDFQAVWKTCSKFKFEGTRTTSFIPNFEQLILSLHFINLTVLSTEPYLFRN